MKEKKKGISLNAYYIRCATIDYLRIYCPNDHCILDAMRPVDHYIGSFTCDKCGIKYPIGQLKLYAIRRQKPRPLAGSNWSSGWEGNLHANFIDIYNSR